MNQLIHPQNVQNITDLINVFFAQHNHFKNLYYKNMVFRQWVLIKGG